MRSQCEPLVLTDSVARYHDRVVDEVSFAHSHAVNVLDLDVLHVSLSGSHAYGSAHDGSDVDVNVVYLPDDATLFGLRRPRPFEHMSPSKNGHDIRFIGLPDLLIQMHKGSYPFVEVLWSPTWFATPVMARLAGDRKVFLTSSFAESCIGHASSVVHDIENGDSVTSKNVTHAMRVLSLVSGVIRYGDLFLSDHGDDIRNTTNSQSDRDALVEMFHAIRERPESPGNLLDRHPDYGWMKTTAVDLVHDAMHARK